MMPDTEMAQRVARRHWPSISSQTTVDYMPPSRQRTKPPSDIDCGEDHIIEIRRFLILPNTELFMGYSAELDALVIVDEHNYTMYMRQGLLMIVDSLERKLNTNPTTSQLRKEQRRLR